MTLLLGKNAADYLASIKAPWDGSIVKMDQDLIGANGWNSLEEVFYALNNTVNYVVLRNFEGLPHRYDPRVHKDIDFLTDDREQLRLILNQPASLFRTPVQVKFNIGDQQIVWDVRHVGDDYYCQQWEQDMLQDRVLCSENVYVLNNEHYFYSLVNHALLHKKAIPEDYYVKTEHLVNSLSLDQPCEPFPHVFDYYFDLLGEYMRRKNYVFCSPHASWCNHIIMNLHPIADKLEKRFGLKRVKPIHVISRTGFTHDRIRTFFQAWLNGRRIFIKHFGGCQRYRRTSKTPKMEFLLSNQSYRTNANNFQEVLFYSEAKHYRCIAFDFLEGETIGSKIKSVEFSALEKADVILQLKYIAKTLIETGIVHDDMHLGNFIIAKDGKLKLIDFGTAVDSKRHEKSYASSNNPVQLFLFLANKIAGQDHSSDMINMLKILEIIGCQGSYQETYCDVEVFLREHIQVQSAKHKFRQFLRVFRVPSKLEYHVKHVVRPFFHRLKRIVGG